MTALGRVARSLINRVKQAKKDAGLPDNDRRDPHKPGESPALQGMFFAGRARHELRPGRLPIIQMRAEFFPIERLRTGEKICGGVLAEAFTNRVRPDVACNRFQSIRCAQNVVVEFCLPERTCGSIFVRESGALFESHDEREEIGLRRAALGEEMKMIGHEAKGVEQEGVTR